MDASTHVICQFSKVSDTEWKQIMPRYREQQAEWHTIPNFVWVMLILSSISFVFYIQNWWGIVGVIISLYSAAQIGSRSGNIDGFQIGYEWGKEQAIMQAYKLSPEQLNDIIEENNEIEYHANKQNA